MVSIDMNVERGRVLNKRPLPAQVRGVTSRAPNLKSAGNLLPIAPLSGKIPIFSISHFPLSQRLYLFSFPNPNSQIWKPQINKISTNFPKKTDETLGTTI